MYPAQVVGLFPQKIPLVHGSFAERDLHLKASLGIIGTNPDSQWNLVYIVFRQIRFCGKQEIGRSNPKGESCTQCTGRAAGSKH